MAKKGRGDRDWQRYERDWKGYERYRRDEVSLFLTKMKSLVEGNPPPWSPKKRGQPPYPSKAHGHPAPAQNMAWYGLPEHQRLPTRLPGSTCEDRLG
jgi:hypothetical protein